MAGVKDAMVKTGSQASRGKMTTVLVVFGFNVF